MDAVIRAQGLCLRGNAGLRLTDVNLAVPPGSRTWVRSSDEASLSLLVRGLATLTRPDGGSLNVGGVDAVRDPLGARRHALFLGPDARLPHGLTVREYIQLVARSRQVGEVAAERLAEHHGLKPGTLVDRLSDPDRRRAFAAGAAAANVRVRLVQLPAAAAADEVAVRDESTTSERAAALIVACAEAPGAAGWDVFTLEHGLLAREA